jgi:choline dehydrogenase-like flavoprotein
LRKKVIIIGSGVAGVGASLQFVRKGIKPCILDIGYENKLDNTPIEENIYDFCENRNSFEFLIGESQSGLRSIDRRNTYLPAKLTAPRLNYITHNVSKLSPIQEEKYNAVQSFSKGGLANGWGAGLYRFDDNDLQHFPIDAHELDKYYNDLTEEIGISGTIDDLSPFFGNGENLQKELNISKNANILYKKYRKKSDKLNKQGIFIGRPRLGVLSDTKHERQKCDYNNLEFWQHDLDYIYSPKYTLNRLIKKNEVDYINNTLVKYYQERDGEITVYTKNSENNKEVVYKCDKLIIAAGGIGSAKIVLQSNQDYTTKLKLLDNPSIQIPLVFPKQIGKKL